MYYNLTLAPSNVYTSIDKPMKKDINLMALKLGLDNAVLEYKAKQHGLDYIPKINQTVQAFPYVPDRVFKDLDVVSMYGSFYLIMVPLCVFMVIYDELMREKSDKLRLGMQVLGTQDNAYWVSWIITGSVMNAIMAIEMIVVGRIYGFDVFVKTPAWVFFLIIFITTETYISMAICFSTIASNKT